MEKSVKATGRHLSVEALLIDLDGTLVDVTEALVEAARRALLTVGMADVNPQIGVEMARKLQSNLPLNGLLRQKRIVGAQKERFVKAYINAFHKLASSKTKPLPNVHATLRKLSRHFPLALVTRRGVPKNQLIKELKRLQLNKYFKAVVTSKEVKHPQPSPDILLKAAKKLNVPIEKCAVISDSIVDIQAGKASGAKTIAVLSGLFSREELERWKPDLIIKNISLLPDLLTKPQKQDG